MKNIYIISNESIRLIELEINKIIDSDDEVIKYNYQDNTWSDLITEFSYPSLDKKRKVLIVSNSSFLSSKTDDDDKIIDFINNINSNNIIIFVSNNIDFRKNIVKYIKENQVFIDIPKINYKNIYDYINKYLSNNKYSIDFKGSGYLVNLYGLNIDLIFNELDKLMLYYGKPCQIKYNDCLNIVSVPFDNNVFHFIEAIIEKQQVKALKIYQDLKVSKVEESMLIILLYKEFRKLFYIKKYIQNHASTDKIIKDLNLLSWQLEKLYNNSQNYSEKELLKNIKLLGQIDKDIKTGNIDKEIVIQNFILKYI